MATTRLTKLGLHGGPTTDVVTKATPEPYVVTGYVDGAYVYPIQTLPVAITESGDDLEAEGTVSNYGFIEGTVAYTEADDIVSANGFVGVTKVGLGTLTKLGLFGAPVTHPGQLVGDTAETRIIENADIVSASGGVEISGSSADTERHDIVTAFGSANIGSTYSNAWFNEFWFNSNWFNSDWFVASTVGPDGTATVLETGDTASAFGTTPHKGTASITEGRDTASAFGSAGNDILGTAHVFENTDSTLFFGRVRITAAPVAITETSDTVAAFGSVSVLTVKLSWKKTGFFSSIDIYRSTDNVTFTHIAHVPGNQKEYFDAISDQSKDYYYYLVGQTTTDVTVNSSTALLDLPN